MKQKFFFLFVLLALSVPNPLFASNGGSKVAGIKTKLEEKIEAREAKLLQIQEKIQNKIQLKTASREAKLTQIKQNLIKKYYQQMSKRMWATIDRLEILISRIDARIAIIDGEGNKDLTSVKANVSQAKSLIADTKVLLTSSDIMIDSVIGSNNPKDAFVILKSNITDIKTNLKEVHGLLVKVIGDIAGLRVGNVKITPVVTPKAL